MPHDLHKSKSELVTSILLANHCRFLSFLESRVGSRDDAEEILQDAFVRSVQKGDEIRNSENTVAWFYRLLRNAVVDYYRRRSAGNRLLETFARQLSDSDERADPTTQKVVCECVHELVAVLKPEHADLITQVDLQGADVGTVAESLGITPGNVRVRLHRARAALRQEVERTCRTCATHGCMDCTCGKQERDCNEAE